MKQTTYSIAINWLRPAIVLCNNIPEIDDSVYDNARFDWEDKEIYQWYITDLSSDDIDWLELNFPGLLFTFSDKLDCFILCVDHWGTAWTHVSTSVSDKLLKYNPEIEYKDSCNPPEFITKREIKNPEV